MLEHALAIAQTNWDRYLEDFKQLLSIPTVSADPVFKADVRRTAEWILSEMQRIGLHNCRLLESAGHPAVYGEWLEAGPQKPTILMYAHYDTQPVDPLELWETPPFESAVRDGRLYARGAIDDKAGVHVNLKAVETILAADGALPANFKFFFEGEEESGSPSMTGIIQQNKELLRSDLFVVSDGGCEEDQPYVLTSVRGIVGAEVRVRGPVRDLHSGSYGGVVLNPAHIVATIIASIYREDGRIQIPGYYDAVRPLTKVEPGAEWIDERDLTLAHRDTGLEKEELWGLDGYSYNQRQTALPTFDVNGLYSGYQGVGMKTIIPAEAGFKASMRLVADQDPRDIAEKFSAYVKSFERLGAKIDVTLKGAGWAVQCLEDGPVIEAIQQSYVATYGRPAILYRQGGSVPLLGIIHAELGTPITNLGFGNGQNGHSPNEFVFLKYLQLDLQTALHFYYNISMRLKPAGGR
jgi:acetylornithine deacetylase/succinyl-diaminopimelate desuccinylase-like protein